MTRFQPGDRVKPKRAWLYAGRMIGSTMAWPDQSTGTVVRCGPLYCMVEYADGQQRSWNVNNLEIVEDDGGDGEEGRD